MIDSCINRSLMVAKAPSIFYSNFFWNILVLKFSLTLFAFFIYARYTPFIDASVYLCVGPSCIDNGTVPLRTEFVLVFFKLLRMIFFSELAVHLFMSFSLAYILWYVFKKSYYFLNKPLFYCSLCLPHFMIWSGMVGKEAIGIAGFLLLIRACVDLTIKKSTKIFPLILGIFFSILVRPHYAIAYGYLLLVAIMLSRFRCKALDLPKHSILLLFFCLTCVVAFISVYWKQFSTELLNFMHIIKFQYFLSQVSSKANRLDIIWEKPSDFIFNLWWGLPISIVGPTLHEAIARPLIFPAFLEGLFSLGLFVFIIYKIIRCAFDNPKYNAVIFLGLIPSILLGLLINYPFGLFNPGSAIRYKQSLAPLFYFYPLLFMSEIKKKNFLGRGMAT